jgi:hypothetical protein
VVWNSPTPPPTQSAAGRTPQCATAHYHDHLTAGNSTPPTSAPVSTSPSYSEVLQSSPAQQTSTLPPHPPRNATTLLKIRHLHAALHHDESPTLPLCVAERPQLPQALPATVPRLVAQATGSRRAIAGHCMR